LSCDTEQNETDNGDNLRKLRLAAETTLHDLDSQSPRPIICPVKPPGNYRSRRDSASRRAAVKTMQLQLGLLARLR